MGIKAKSIMLENFVHFEKIKVSFDDKITYLVGPNGSGKSTLGIYGFQFIMEGIAEKTPSKDRHPIIGNRYNFIGKHDKFAKGHLVLYDDKLGCDIVVKRKITASENTLSFEAPEGMHLDQEWLTDLFNILMLSPKHFEALSPQEQAIALGIDTSEYDKQLKDKKAEYTVIGRQLKALGDVPEIEPEKEEPLDLEDIHNELLKAYSHNADVVLLKSKKEAVLNKRAELLDQLKALDKEIENFADTPESTDVVALEESYLEAKEHNEKIAERNEAAKKYNEKKKIESELAKNKKDQYSIQQDKIKYLQKAELPFDNLNIDEEGRLMLDGKFIKAPYFSTGELISIITRLIVSQNPELKYVYLQDFNLLDENKQASIIKDLSELDLQMVVEYISTEEMMADNVILLRDSSVVKNDDADEKEPSDEGVSSF